MVDSHVFNKSIYHYMIYGYYMDENLCNFSLVEQKHFQNLLTMKPLFGEVQIITHFCDE